MIITTTPNIEGKRIAEYLGVVTGEAIMALLIWDTKSITEYTTELMSLPKAKDI